MVKQSAFSRRISYRFHRRFPTVESYVAELGGDKGIVIKKILIANNGVGAVKAIRSIRRWAYDIFGDEHAISFVVMATPEDLRANAEYIRMGDVIVDVPGGSNNHNYANVNLIVELARLHSVNAVWAGWGHASENPHLPDSLAQSNPPIKFIGPSGPPMRALGDKIGSTIIAQSAGVPCIAWNASDVIATYDREKGTLPDSAYEQATIKDADHAVEASQKVGFPIMIKASEGGGGKGIRRVDSPENVRTAYRQVCGEVPGSPIFIMKLSSNSRHLEVQLLGDEYGNAVALNGRDCSVQRRHQKIIEEGPPVAAPPDVWKEMEKAAVSLAKAVGYTNAGTVEYLYSEEEAKFYFLELNPRLQVEHPVTEMITRVNLPAAQLQVAMGIPLYNIPEIRELYGRHRFERESGSGVIDFDNEEMRGPYGHCIAVRITAENAEAGFKPTSGGIQELNFRSTPNVWGYFSMDSSGSIHEFADSQFGHLFANGPDREQARRNMVLALKELSIRGDISTTVDYISKLIEIPDFIQNRITTSWLDGLIKANVDGMGAADKSLSTQSDSLNHTYVVLGASIMAYDLCSDGEKEFQALLEKGQLPAQSLLKMEHDIELILSGIKYKLVCTRHAPQIFSLSVAGNTEMSVSVSVRQLSDGGYLIDIGGKSHVAYSTSKGDAASGMRLNVGGANIAFSPDYDPTSLRTDVAGKLVKKLVPDGTSVNKGDAYAEIEVMKMIMPLKVEETGTVTWNSNEGAALAAGDLLASLELANPENVSPVTEFQDNLNVEGWGQTTGSGGQQQPHLLFRSAINKIKGGMAGYVLGAGGLDVALQELEQAVSDPLLPVHDIEEQLSVLSGRIPATLFDEISEMINEFKNSIEEHSGTTIQMRFPSERVVQLLDETSSATAEAEKAGFDTLTAPLRDAATPFTKSHASDVPGAERAMVALLEAMKQWASVEKWFCEATSHADAVDSLRKAHKDNSSAVLDVCRAHAQLATTSLIVSKAIKLVGDGYRLGTLSSSASASGKKISMLTGAESLGAAIICLQDIAAMKHSDAHAEVALQAQKVILQESMPSLEQRSKRYGDAASKLEKSTANGEIADLLSENLPLDDVFFPLLAKSTKEGETCLLELLARYLYKPYAVDSFKQDANSRTLTFSFSSDSKKTKRTGVFAIVDGVEGLDNKDTLQQILSKFPAGTETSANVLYIVLAGTMSADDADGMNAMSQAYSQALSPHIALLKGAGICDVTFMVDKKEVEIGEHPAPALFTLRAPEFKEDELSRHLDPSLVVHLDLGRIAENFDVKNVGSRHTSTCNVTTYAATPKSSALAKDAKANKSPRLFARALSYVLDFSSSNFERTLGDALDAMDLVSSTSKADNHLFINFVGDSEGVVLDLVVVEQVLAENLKRQSSRMSNLGIVEVETRVVCSLTEDSPPTALRVIASNPTGYVQVMSTYVEEEAELGGGLVFKLIGGTKASLAGSGDNSWEGLSVSAPYPLTRPYDAQRKAALKATDTLYCYDIPALFEAAVEEQWAESKTGSTRSAVSIRSSVRPLMVTYTSELVVQRKEEPHDGHWTMQDYVNGDLELVPISRSAGANDVGMVAWLMNLRTVEYPEGRDVVLVANDITFKAGSFGTREDVVFKLASEFARARQIPRLYVAANSGARIGLAESIKKTFKVAFKDASKPENGFDFLYVTKDDYATLTETKQQLVVEDATYNGEDVLKITDVIGVEPDLGVENLKGSGLIAGETSIAYDDIFTLTIVMGRTVGIGAYLVRLGQRTIQKTTSSPIILTGYQALNKLMGVNVYQTNDQLGGPGIMYPNGVSHIVENDHMRVVKSALHWLSFVPSSRGGILPVTDIRGVDEIERTIDFSPSPGVPYDPRLLLAGGEDADGGWQTGFFDKGSFTETLSGWAKTVIVGRARLGGIPMGVVITENRTAENVKPADPADAKASEAVIQEAGCVWFPNSAYKTAQAIKDFRTEDLPLIVFANWRGFSGGQRDMFDEVLKYGSLIVDAFVAYQQPVFVFIPPYAEVRGGAWVVLDASINAAVMEMYAAKGTARGGVLEPNGAASVKYRKKHLLTTMHRLDHELVKLDAKLKEGGDDAATKALIAKREKSLLPVYEQIAVQFCDLHDTPGRMKAVGVIDQEVEWKNARSFFYWRLRRKLAEFDLRKKMVEASSVVESSSSLTPLKASAQLKEWFVSSGESDESWEDDKLLLQWMEENDSDLEDKIKGLRKASVSDGVVRVMSAAGVVMATGVASEGVVDGVAKAAESMSAEEKQKFKEALIAALG